MRKGMSKNPAGIGGHREETEFGGFVSHTGGDIVQRRIERNYSKTAHAARKKELEDADDLIQPIADVSKPYRVF